MLTFVMHTVLLGYLSLAHVAGYLAGWPVDLHPLRWSSTLNRGSRASWIWHFAQDKQQQHYCQHGQLALHYQYNPAWVFHTNIPFHERCTHPASLSLVSWLLNPWFPVYLPYNRWPRFRYSTAFKFGAPTIEEPNRYQGKLLRIVYSNIHAVFFLCRYLQR